MRSQFESGDTQLFTWVSSVAPDAAPGFAVYGPGDTLVASATAQQSGSTQFYAPFTMPLSADGVYLGEWRATKTAAGQAYPVRSRILFNVVTTRRAEA